MIDSGERRRRGVAGARGPSEVVDSVLRGLQDGMRNRVRTRFAFEPDWTSRASTCTLTVQMALFTLRTFHVLKPAMTGWQAYVAAERIVPTSTANNQQPRGY
jgi:hypothetical protein